MMSIDDVRSFNIQSINQQGTASTWRLTYYENPTARATCKQQNGIFRPTCYFICAGAVQVRFDDIDNRFFVRRRHTSCPIKSQDNCTGTNGDE
jgi:hypothetical protein